MDICIDFDGTIVDHAFPKIGKDNPDAIIWMKKWQEEGARLILFTMRSDGQECGDTLTEAVQYLKDNGVEMYGVNKNPGQDTWTSSPKAYGQVYVDDAALGCPMIDIPGFNHPCVNWLIVGPSVYGMLLEAAQT